MGFRDDPSAVFYRLWNLESFLLTLEYSFLDDVS